MPIKLTPDTTFTEPLLDVPQQAQSIGLWPSLLAAAIVFTIVYYFGIRPLWLPRKQPQRVCDYTVHETAVKAAIISAITSEHLKSCFKMIVEFDEQRRRTNLPHIVEKSVSALWTMYNQKKAVIKNG